MKGCLRPVRFVTVKGLRHAHEPPDRDNGGEKGEAPCDASRPVLAFDEAAPTTNLVATCADRANPAVAIAPVS